MLSNPLLMFSSFSSAALSLFVMLTEALNLAHNIYFCLLDNDH